MLCSIANLYIVILPFGHESQRPVDDRANPSLNLNLDDLPIERVLGLHWDAESDTFQFKSISIDKPYTKRGILSVVSSLIYDPLGFLSPLTFLPKVLLQTLWRIGVQWDEQIFTVAYVDL